MSAMLHAWLAPAEREWKSHVLLPIKDKYSARIIITFCDTCKYTSNYSDVKSEYEKQDPENCGIRFFSGRKGELTSGAVQCLSR